MSSASASATVIAEPFNELFAIRYQHDRELHDARELATAACMKSRGFDYRPRDYVKPLRESRRIGDEQYATREGFGLSPDGPPLVSQSPDELRTLGPAAAAAWTEAYFGRRIDPQQIANGQSADKSIVVIDNGEDGVVYFRKDSCIAAGRQAVEGDLVEWSAVDGKLQSMRNDVIRAVESDPRYVEAMTGWASCMREAGYGAKSRQEQIEELLKAIDLEGGKSGSLKEREIAVATSSARCEVSLGIGPLYQSLLNEHQEVVGRVNEGTILRFQELEREAEKRAEELLSRR
ncbi:hypothetical protein [Micropruina sp.]|uniref:hypothetical protein n=1 Tax=Micropruina sp. TaxID=2737536 RepID=UPI0039E6F800